MEHPLKVVGACNGCVRRSARYSVIVVGTPNELCQSCLSGLDTRPAQITQLFDAPLPEDVREGYALTDQAAAMLDRMRQNERLSNLTLYEVTPEGGMLGSVKAADRLAHYTDFQITPDGSVFI